MIEQENNDKNRENILLLNNKYSAEKENNIENNTIINSKRIMNNIQQIK